MVGECLDVRVSLPKFMNAIVRLWYPYTLKVVNSIGTVPFSPSQCLVGLSLVYYMVTQKHKASRHYSLRNSSQVVFLPSF